MRYALLYGRGGWKNNNEKNLKKKIIIIALRFRISFYVTAFAPARLSQSFFYTDSVLAVGGPLFLLLFIDIFYNKRYRFFFFHIVDAGRQCILIIIIQNAKWNLISIDYVLEDDGHRILHITLYVEIHCSRSHRGHRANRITDFFIIWFFFFNFHHARVYVYTPQRRWLLKKKKYK